MKMSVSGKSVLVGFLLASVLGLIACHQEGPAEKAGQKIDQAVDQAGKKIDQVTEQAGKKIEKAEVALSEKSKKAGEFIDDTAITTKIKAEIAKDPMLKVSQISVETKNGVVRLSGVVDSPQSIDRVLEIIRNVKNVQSTENGLVVKSAK
jgi:hyperosmotically inducible protein